MEQPPTRDTKKAGNGKNNNVLTLNFEIDNILVDINPYFDFTYYNKYLRSTVGYHDKKNEEKNKALLFYSDSRSLIAINEISVRLNKGGGGGGGDSGVASNGGERGLHLESIKIESVDFLMKKVDMLDIEN